MHIRSFRFIFTADAWPFLRLSGHDPVPSGIMAGGGFREYADRSIVVDNRGHFSDNTWINVPDRRREVFSGRYKEKLA